MAALSSTSWPRVFRESKAVGLVEPAGGLNRDDLADGAGVDLRLGRLDDRVVAPVVADEQRNAEALGLLDQAARRPCLVGDRLLDKQGQPGAQTGEPVLDVQLIRRRDDDAVGRIRRQHIGERLMPHEILLGREGRR